MEPPENWRRPSLGNGAEIISPKNVFYESAHILGTIEKAAFVLP